MLPARHTGGHRDALPYPSLLFIDDESMNETTSLTHYCRSHYPFREFASV